MTPEVISAILTGLAGLVTALGALYTVRRKSIDADASANYRELLSLRRDNAKYRRKEVLMLRWLHQAELVAAQKGVELPAMPAELDNLLNGGGGGESGPIPVPEQ